MSKTIRTFIRQALIESAMEEIGPRRPSWFDLDEAGPRRPSPSSRSSSPSPPASSSGGAPPTAPGDYDMSLSLYVDDCVQFLSDNSVRIGYAADYLAELVTGFLSPDEIMSVYHDARAIDEKHNEFGPGHRNYAVNLLGVCLSSLTGQAFVNFAPDVMKKAEELIRGAASAVSPKKESFGRRGGSLLKEGSVAGQLGKIIRHRLDDIVAEGGADAVLLKAIKDEASLAARTAANNTKELEKILAGGTTDDLLNVTLPAYVRRELRLAVESQPLEGVGEAWSRAALADLRRANKNITNPTIGDLLGAKTPLSPESTSARDILKRKMSKINNTPDSEIYSAVSDADRAAVATKAGEGWLAGAGRVLKGASTPAGQAASTTAANFPGWVKGLGLTTVVGVVAFGYYVDDVSPMEIDPSMLQAIYALQGEGYTPATKITAFDIYLKQFWNDTARFNSVRTMLTNVCSEYWDFPGSDTVGISDISGCQEFQATLARGVQVSASSGE